MLRWTPLNNPPLRDKMGVAKLPNFYLKGLDFKVCYNVNF